MRQNHRIVAKNILIKVTLSILLLVWLYTQIKGRMTGIDFTNQYWNSSHSWTALFLAILLMPINWGLEARKWQIIMSPIRLLTWAQSFSGIFAGITMAILTPARLGDFAGRIMTLEPGDRKSGSAYTIIANVAQWAASGTLGLVAAIYYSQREFNVFGNSNPQVIFLILALMTLGITLAYFNISIWLPSLVHRFGGKLSPWFEGLQWPAQQVLFKLWFLSLLRFCVFAVQYLLFLKAFGIQIPFIEGLAAIGSILFVQHFLPIPVIAELPMRANLVLLFLGAYSVSSIGLIAAASSLWLCNLLLPALLGYFRILNTKVFKS